MCKHRDSTRAKTPPHLRFPPRMQSAQGSAHSGHIATLCCPRLSVSGLARPSGGSVTACQHIEATCDTGVTEGQSPGTVLKSRVAADARRITASPRSARHMCVIVASRGVTHTSLETLCRAGLWDIFLCVAKPTEARFRWQLKHKE